MGKLRSICRYCRRTNHPTTRDPLRSLRLRNILPIFVSAAFPRNLKKQAQDKQESTWRPYQLILIGPQCLQCTNCTFRDEQKSWKVNDKWYPYFLCLFAAAKHAPYLTRHTCVTRTLMPSALRPNACSMASAALRPAPPKRDNNKVDSIS